MRKNIKKILLIFFIILFGLICYNKVYAVENTKTVTGKEIQATQEEIKKMMYDAEMGDFDMEASLRLFTVVSQELEDEYLGLGGEGFAKKTIINDVDYINKYFLFESSNYLGESFNIEGVGTFKYEGYNQSITFDTNYHRYMCKITNNDFKKDDGEIRYFELLETDSITGEKHKNKIFLNFYKKLYRDDISTGIKLEGTTESLPRDVEFITDTIDNTGITILNKDKLVVYDITLKSNEEKIQPKRDVKIKIPIPKDFDDSKLVVYRIENDKQIPYEVEVQTIDNQKYAIFKTGHFSTYVLAGNSKENEQIKDDNSLNNENKQEHKLDNEPKTGIENNMLVVSVIFVLSLLGLIVVKSKLNN